MLTLPPGPPDGRLVQTVRFHRDPLRFLREQQRVFGDVFTIRLLAAGPTVVVADASAVPLLAGSDPTRGHAGEARRRILGMVSSHSVLGADGEEHHAARRRVAAVFTPEAIDRRRDAIAELAEAHAASWPRRRPTRLLPRVRTLVDDVFVRLVLGVREEQRARALVPAIRRMLWTPGYPPLPPPGEGAGLLGALAGRVFDRRCEPVRRLLASELEARRSTGSDPRALGDDRAGGDFATADLIGAMVDGDPPLTTGAAIDQLIPLLMAGQEPPATALAWLLDRCAREPAWAEELRVGARDGEGRPHDRFVRETLRLRPAVHSIMRRLTVPIEIADHTLPAGAVATVPIVLLHRDPSAFPRPDRFRPERWATDSGGHAFLPFGGGERRCLGEPLAHALIETALPAILRTVRLRAIGRGPERMVVRGTVLAARHSALVSITPV